MRLSGILALAAASLFPSYLLSPQQLNAATVWVGSDGTGPLQAFSGDLTTLLGTYGQPDGTAGAANEHGGLFTVTPGDTSSTFNVYGTGQDLLSSFVFTGPGQSGDFASYVIDMTWGSSNTFWASTYTGTIYQFTSGGTILGQFETGATAPGVTTDGTHLYTTSGPGIDSSNPNIYQRDLAGAILATIDTGLNDTLGIGYDAFTNSFLVGGFDTVTRVSAAGAILDTYAIEGVHYGVEAGDLVATVPEPSSLALLMAGMLVLLATLRPGVGFWRRIIRASSLAFVPLMMLLLAAVMPAAVSISTFTATPPAPSVVGTPITFAVGASDTDTGDLRYRFRVRQASGVYSVYRDYSPGTSFIWNPGEAEGTFQIEVSVTNRATGSGTSQSQTYAVSPRIAGSTPAANPTSHPLVALYSAPRCALGSNMRVRFKLSADAYWQSTAVKPCNNVTTMNFYIAGMRASSSYQLRHDVLAGPRVTTGAIVNFTTGAAGISIPAVTVAQAIPAASRQTAGISIYAGISFFGAGPTFAADADGNVVWYSPSNPGYLTRFTRGGTLIQLFGMGFNMSVSGFQEFDLTGVVIKETNVERVNDQLTQLGRSPITTFHHEVRRLPNGHYMCLALVERRGTIQGGADVLGDMIVVLDNDLNVVWTWDSFDHLDVNRLAVLGETSVPDIGTPFFQASIANDWTHGNSIALTPDGNIVYSSRHQDMGYKIAYQNGTGDGHVIWKLGKDGDFAWISGDIHPWFSHQHDIEYEDATTLTVNDNGNARVALYGGNSRGQALQLDEVNMRVTPVLNVDLGFFSFALGSAERLSNGDYFFGSGIVQDGGAPTRGTQWSLAGSLNSLLTTTKPNYRIFRLRDLYSAP